MVEGGGGQGLESSNAAKISLEINFTVSVLNGSIV